MPDLLLIVLHSLLFYLFNAESVSASDDPDPNYSSEYSDTSAALLHNHQTRSCLRSISALVSFNRRLIECLRLSDHCGLSSEVKRLSQPSRAEKRLKRRNTDELCSRELETAVRVCVYQNFHLK